MAKTAPAKALIAATAVLIAASSTAIAGDYGYGYAGLNAYRDDNHDVLGSTDYRFDEGQCTWFIAAVVPNPQNPCPKTPGGRDAMNWYPLAVAAGLLTGGSPQVNAILCMDGTIGGGHGHVALVLGVDGDTLTVADANWHTPPDGVVRVHTMSASHSGIQGYIYRGGGGADNALFKADPGHSDSPNLRVDTVYCHPGDQRTYTLYCYNCGESTWPANGQYYLHQNGHQLGIGPAYDYLQVDWTTTPGNAWTRAVVFTFPNVSAPYRFTGRMARKDGDNYIEFGEWIDVDFYAYYDTDVPEAVGRGSSNRQKFVECFVRNGGIPNVGLPTDDVASWGTNVPERQDFTGGAGLDGQIQWNLLTAAAYWLHGSHRQKYDEELLGCAISDAVSIGPSPFGTSGVTQDFRKADGSRTAMYCAFGGQAFRNYGNHWTRYVAFGGPYSYLGWPTGDPAGNGTDDWQAYEKGWTTRDSYPVVFPSFPTPTTTPTILEGTKGSNDWYTTPVKIQLQPSICSTDRYWRYAGEDWQYNAPVRAKADWNPADTRLVDYTGQPFTVSRSGQITIEYYSRMTAGGVVAPDQPPHVPEASKQLSLKIDPDPPSESQIAFDPATSVRVGTAVTLHVTCSDATSGIDRGEVWFRREDTGSEDGGTWWTKIGDFTGATGTLTWNTTGLAATQYHIHVNCWDKAGNYQWHPCFHYELTPAGTPPPTVVSATYVDWTHVDVEFSEALDKTTAEVAGNYTGDHSLSVTGAALQADGKTVRLTTAWQDGGLSYTVTASKVKDAAGNLIVTGVGDSASWSTPERWRRCDLDGDGTLGPPDLKLFMDSWRKQRLGQGTDPAADFDGDGKISQADARRIVDDLLSREGR